MCTRDKVSPSLSLIATLILLLCACAVAVHFIAEGFTLAAGETGFDLVAQEGYAHEHSEDHFVLPFSIRLEIKYTAIYVISPLISHAFSFFLSPQPPPPDFQIHNG